MARLSITVGNCFRASNISNATLLTIFKRTPQKYSFFTCATQTKHHSPMSSAATRMAAISCFPMSVCNTYVFQRSRCLSNHWPNMSTTSLFSIPKTLRFRSTNKFTSHVIPTISCTARSQVPLLVETHTDSSGRCAPTNLKVFSCIEAMFWLED